MSIGGQMTEKKLKLGYYNHGHYIKDVNGKVYVSFDIAIWADRFVELCDEFVCFLNSKTEVLYKEADIPKSFYLLNPKAGIVDIGKQRPHWQKAVGIGLNKDEIYKTTKELHWLIIQGPTPQQNSIAKAVHPNCKIAPLLVGIWIKWPSQMFRQAGIKNTIKEKLINVLKKYNRYQTIQLLNKYAKLPMGNNPEMPIFYKSKKPFQLVSKGLIKESEIVKREKSLNSDTIKLVFYSRLDPEKNVELLIEAVNILNKRGVKTELKVYGGSPMTEYLSFLKNKAVLLNVEEQVQFMGEVHNQKKLEVFTNSDIYIFNTCTTEGFPRTVWEAFASGTPTVCSNYPGADKFFTKGEVLLYRQNNATELAERIIELSSNNELRIQTIANAYSLLQENTLEKSTQYLHDLLLNNC